MADKAKGPNQGLNGTNTSRAMAALARGGGKTGSPGAGAPQRHAQPSLPTPQPTHPEAAAPYKPPVPMPTRRTPMSGTMQNGTGVRPGRSDLSPLRNRRPGPQ